MAIGVGGSLKPQGAPHLTTEKKINKKVGKRKKPRQKTEAGLEGWVVDGSRLWVVGCRGTHTVNTESV